MSNIEEVMQPLRESLRPRGTADIAVLQLNSGCTVRGALVRTAIDEIIKHHTIGILLGDQETACMQLAKIVLMDSANLGVNG